jgi:hypothetical protein
MTKELSPLAKQLLGGAGTIDLFTQSEFDEALALARAEIMTVAIETTKQAIRIEREECAKLVEEEDEYGYKELAERIRNRIPSQRQ